MRAGCCIPCASIVASLYEAVTAHTPFVPIVAHGAHANVPGQSGSRKQVGRHEGLGVGYAVVTYLFGPD